MVSITEWQKIGVGTAGFGIFFILLGILLYFDSVLLAFGNLLFLTGLSFIIGLRKTCSFFFQRHKLKGTSFFFGGVAIVLLRWPLLGMLLEAYGFFNLFRGFFPVAFGFLGNAFDIPYLSAFLTEYELDLYCIGGSFAVPEASRQQLNGLSREMNSLNLESPSREPEGTWRPAPACLQ